MARNVYDLLNKDWRKDIKLFTENEFSNVVLIDGRFVKMSYDQINSLYNADEYKPRDGEMIKAVDELTAFVEAYTSIRHGITDSELEQARNNIRDKYSGKTVSGINFGGLIADFD